MNGSRELERKGMTNIERQPGGDAARAVVPRDAAALILLRRPESPELFWVKRSLALSFMGGWMAFPGGARTEEDLTIAVANCDDPFGAAMRVCAIREVFEETGLLIARGVDQLDRDRLTFLREQLLCNRIDFAELLSGDGLSLDANLLTEAPRWVTPATSPKRFNTLFFVSWVPPCLDGEQEASVIPGELESGEWLSAAAAIGRWERGEVLIAPPILRPIEEMVKGIEGFPARLQKTLDEEEDSHFRLEFRYGFVTCPVRTPTLPPATHTNCYLIGGDEFVIIDPGSPYEDEQRKLDGVISVMLAEGRKAREIIVTHLHPDHIGGVNHLREKFGIPVATHRLTAEAIEPGIKVDRFIEDEDLIELRGGRVHPDMTWTLRALWSPGHARGHLSFYEERTGSLITGDCIVGVGTVVIAPPEGNLADYMTSLRRYLTMRKLTAIFPAHGPALADARGKVEEYIAHRHEREVSIVNALERAGKLTISGLSKKSTQTSRSRDTIWPSVPCLPISKNLRRGSCECG
jgi:glyoxylase-like metal-dependent hydrolase (beta-lactamase superfamily II)/8-oxo-dGTP pyrophosphatase MutT (NUDIX family)